MRGRGLLVAGLALVFIGLVGLAVVSIGFPAWDRIFGPSGFRSNGERIYYTATSGSGMPITFTGGPHWFRVHGGSCASCHGPDGRGGFVVPMTNVVASDIRYSALTSEEHGEEEHPPYTETTIKRAITQGLDPAGEPLHWAMPRWRMSERDLDDLVAYLKTLGNEEQIPER